MPRNPYPIEAGLALEDVAAGHASEIRLLRDYARTLSDPGLQQRSRFLSFHGISGIGKSRLLRRALGAPGAAERTRVVVVDLDDYGLPAVGTAPDFLWLLRQRLRAAGVRTSLFDFYYAGYYERANPGSRLTPAGVLATIAEKSEGMADLSEAAEGRVEDGAGGLGRFFDADFLQECLGEAAELSKTAGFLAKCATRLRDRRREARLRDEDIVLDRLSLAKLAALAPEVLSLDLLAHLDSRPDDGLLLAVDAIDRLHDESQAALVHPAEAALEEVCRRLLFAPGAPSRRFGFVALGNRPLAWRARFDDAAATDHWDLHFEQHALRGLDTATAESLVALCAAALDRAGFTDEGEQLRARCAHVLAAAGEQEPCPAETFHPLAMRLAIQALLESDPRQPPIALGTGMKSLLARYLRGRPAGTLRMLEVLSLAANFTPALFADMVHRHMIPGVTPADFDRLVRGHPAVIRSDRRTYRIHALLRQSVLDQLKIAEGGEGVLRQVQSDLLAQCVDALSFDQLREIRPAHVQSAQRAFSLLMDWHRNGLLDLCGLLRHWDTVELRFGRDTHYAWSTRRTIVDYLRPLLLVANVEGLEQADTDGGVSRALLQLQILLRNNEEGAAAAQVWNVMNAVQQRRFDRQSPQERARQQELSQRSPEYGFMLIEAARTVHAAGDMRQAHELYEQALALTERLGEGGDRELLRMGATRGIGSCLRQVAIARAMRPLESRALMEAAERFMADAVRSAERVPGMTEVDVALVRLDRAQCLLLLGRTSACDKLLRQGAAAIEAGFPFDHVHRAEVLRMKGNLLVVRARAGEAIPLLQEARRMYAATAGAESPFTRAVESELDTARQLALGIPPSFSQLVKNLP